MQNYFDLLKIKKSFDISLDSLEASYQELVREYHPDKNMDRSSEEQAKAFQNTSLINSAYETLKSPLKRATYLLELENINPFDETDTSMNMDFLMSQIELREELDSFKSNQDELGLDNFIDKIKSLINDNVKNISVNFQKEASLDIIKNLVRELKFYIQLQNQAKTFLDELI
jgi:molecular chaperone HscB